jgi:hypothetical protein
MHRDNHDSNLLISVATQSAPLRDPRREFTRLQLIDSAIRNFSECQFCQRKYATLDWQIAAVSALSNQSSPHRTHPGSGHSLVHHAGTASWTLFQGTPQSVRHRPGFCSRSAGISVHVALETLTKP